MQKREAPASLAARGVGQHGFHLHQLGRLEAGVVLRRLACNSRNPPGSRRS